MLKSAKVALSAACLLGSIAAMAGSGYVRQGHAHENHVTYSAGEPGNPKRQSRTITVKMITDGDTMKFVPAKVEVRRGDQVRFVLHNDDDESHEFMLATVEENRKHAEEMKRFPDMEHDDPNGKRVSAYSTGEILWRFTKRGEFEYACLIPGHYDAGMFGKVIVK
jgi:uncharacterized cupredoxin-like copper-binding protein